MIELAIGIQLQESNIVAIVSESPGLSYMKRSDRGSQIAAIDLFNVAFAGRLDGQVVRAPADRRDDRSPGLRCWQRRALPETIGVHCIDIPWKKFRAVKPSGGIANLGQPERRPYLGHIYNWRAVSTGNGGAHGACQN